MRGLQRATPTGHTSRLDALKHTASLLVQSEPAKATPSGITVRGLEVIRVPVPALSVGLPHFDDGIGYRYTVAIAYTQGDPH
jgi:hypothetical protein